MRIKSNPMKRALSLVLALAALLSLLTVSVSASTIEDGSQTCTLVMNGRNYFLTTNFGTRLGASSYIYTTNDGLSGPAYCIDHGLNYTNRTLPIDGKYTSSVATAAAFATSYPQHSLETFLGRYPNETLLNGLTEDEYAYATQLAVWATLGQLGVEGTRFTAGREQISQPTGDAQQMRVFRVVQLILDAASKWTQVDQTGMYIRVDENELGGNVSVPGDMTLEFAAENETYGFKREVIGGVSYYTHEYIFASATSTYYDGYCIELWADNAPSGYIFTDLSNNELPRGTFRETATWKLPTEWHDTRLNSNGYEYSGTAKLCIPVETAPNSGEITVNCGSYVMQYNIYLARNDISYEQSYIIADPSKGTLTADAVLNWGGPLTETGILEVQKVDGNGNPLAGAKFTLRGSDGSERTGVSGEDGKVTWDFLDPLISYELVEEEPPAGYGVVDSMNVTVKAARTNYITVRDTTAKQLSLKKIDAQNGYSLAGAVIAFEQIDGSFYTEKTTDHAGLIQLDADQLPIGSYRIYEVSSPEGYELSDEVKTVHWDGKRDVSLTLTNVRKPTLVIYKCDEGNNYSLSNAVIGVYKNGQLITTVTTNDSGLAYVPGVSTGYYVCKEKVSPAGYELSDQEYGVYIDAYDPATTDDPRITITNRALPKLRIVKLDRATLSPVDATFEIWKDGVSLGSFQTSNGELFITAETGTYLVKEIQSDDAHIVCSDPQQIRLTAGSGTKELVFFNDKKPGIHLTKLDSADLTKPIANARFKIEAVDGSWGPQELLTGADGTIDLSKLPATAFVVTELECPGYVVDDAQRIIELKPNENMEFVFTDSKLPSLHLRKVDSNGDAVAGAGYRLAKIEDGSRYLDRTTSSTGEITWDGLEPGVYSLVETSTLSNLILDKTEYHVELFAGKTSEIVLENKIRPNLYVYKFTAGTTDPVEGCVFTVRAADGHSVDEIQTDGTGLATLSNLLPGVYEISEKYVPEAWLMDAPSQLVTLYPNRDHTAYFYDHLRPSIMVEKISSVTGDHLQGGKFHVEYASDNTATGELNDLGYYYTGEDGTFSLADQKSGWYRITEVSPPTGYAIEEEAQEFYLEAGGSKTVTFEDVPLSAIVIWKYDSETHAALSSCWFELKYLSDISGTGGTVMATVQTGPNGAATVTGLKKGTYIVSELASDDRHVIDAAPQTVFISGEDQDVVEVFFGNAPKGSALITKTDTEGKPLLGVEFLVTTSDGTLVGDAGGKYVTDASGTALVENIDPGTTLIIRETKTKDSSYVLDDVAQTVRIKAGRTIPVDFVNAKKGSLVILKRSSADRKTPLEGVEFKITYADGSFVDAAGGKLSSNGIYFTDAQGKITISGITGTVVVTETASIDGYAIGGNTRTQTVVVNPDDTQTLYFYNDPVGGVELVKVNEVDRAQRIAGCTFEIREADGGLVATITTDKNGRAFAALEDGGYYAVETVAAKGFKLDVTPHYFTVKDGKPTPLTVTNKAFSGILIHKVSSTTGKGIYGARFLLYDAGHNPIGEYESDQNGYVYIDGLTEAGRYYLRELSNEGYIVDTQLKTVYVRSGETTEVTWRNTPITGQIQVTKTSADYNSMNGWPAGTPIPNTVFEIYDRAGNLADTIQSDKNGVAVTKPLPLGRYRIVESKAADFYGLDKTPIDVEIEFAGQIVKAAMTNKSLYTNVSITKRGYVEVMPGQSIRYDFSGIANNSTTALESFYWRDTFPTSAVRLDKIVTGTWNSVGSYKFVYKTNLSNGEYRVLADSLSTGRNYVLDAGPAALGLAANEYVTEFMAVFGVVPSNFRQVEAPQVYCTVLPALAGGTQFTNVADAGGVYNGQWIMAASRWVTKVYAPPAPAAPLPRTGY